MADRSDAWMPLYIGDYLAATTRLTTEQHGAYLLLLMDYWRNGPPPAEDSVLAQIARVSPAAWRKMKPTIVSFFTQEDGYLVQRRAERERARADGITEKRREAGRASAKARANGQQNGSKRSTHVATQGAANGQQNGRPLQSQEEKKVPFPDGNGGGDPSKSLFDQGVELLVSKGRKEPQARSALAMLQRDHGDAAVLEAINACRGATDPLSAMRSRLGKAARQAEYFGP